MAVLRSCLPAGALALALALSLVVPAMAGSTQSARQAMGAAFPGARIESRVLALSADEARLVEARARVRGTPRLVTAWLAWRGDSLVGAGYADVRTVRTRAATFFTCVAPDTTVLGVEVLAFFEPEEYRPPARWLRLFTGRRLDERLRTGRDVHAITGATLTARSTTESVRLALAWHALVTGPALGKGGEGR